METSDLIDTTILMSADSNGRDPDSHSATLHRFHMRLWAKALPDGRTLNLFDERPAGYIRAEVTGFTHYLSSDGIAHSMSYIGRMKPNLDSVAKEEMDVFYNLCSTIGGYLVFPGRKVGGKATINAARGLHPRVCDRIDLTLECIRRHYAGTPSPLSAVLDRYREFFNLFATFEEYVEFFLLKDLYPNGHGQIRFFLPFDDFQSTPLPKDRNEYSRYRESVTAFVNGRNQRVTAYDLAR